MFRCYNQNTALQQQQNQMNFLMQAQSAQLTLLTRRFDEEEARRKADEARRADPFAAASAEGTSEMSGRIREPEEFHRFLEVLSSWLALTDAFVPELRQCLFVPNKIQQVSSQ